METHTLTCHVEVYSSGKELPLLMQDTLRAAQQYSTGAYAPYSQFQVGAAVLLGSGESIGGSNQENVAYPSGLCAERTALFSAFAQHPTESLEGIAICAMQNGAFLAEPITPCGACRQVLIEYAQRAEKPVWVLLYGAKRILVIRDARALLPLAFGM